MEHGKSTTINMITGITNITEGDILINGKSIQKDPMEAKKQFGLVPDSPDMFLDMSVLKYFNFIADVYKVPSDIREERIKKLAEEFDITRLFKR